MVGRGLFDGNGWRAFLYDFAEGEFIDLGTLGATSTLAEAINQSGDVVGTSTTASGSRAFLYKNGVMQDLNQLVPPDSGWELLDATAINDRGQIAGTGRIGGTIHAFLVTPDSHSSTSR